MSALNPAMQKTVINDGIRTNDYFAKLFLGLRLIPKNSRSTANFFFFYNFLQEINVNTVSLQ